MQVRRFGRVLPGLGPLLTDPVALKLDAGDGAVRPEDLGEGLAGLGGWRGSVGLGALGESTPGPWPPRHRALCL